MTEQFSTPHPITLDIRVAGGEIRVATIDGDQSTVTVDGSPKAVEALTVELTGDRLAIQQRRKSMLSIFERGDYALKIRVEVPHGSRAELSTAAGSAELDGTFADLRSRTASGSLSVTGRIDGDASVETVSGSARLPHVSGGLTARSVSGNLAAAEVEGSVSAKSVSGDVRVGLLHEGQANVQSVSGEIDLGIAQGTGVDIDAASASGRLSSEIPLSDAPDGASGPVVVIRGNTVSGDFRVFRAA